MPAPTYSVASLGYRNNNPFAVKNLTIPDASESGLSASPYSAQQQIMSFGDSLLVRGQSGAIRRMKIDAERSTSGYIVLVPQ